VKQVTFTRSALKVLRKMPANTAKIILAKIDQYATDPASLANNVTALQGRTDGAVRLRVGDWRVIIEDGVVLAVLDIGPRGGIYG
jgi:mRNA interferase RelE/StbE